MTQDTAGPSGPSATPEEAVTPISGDRTFDDRADIADAVRGAQLLLSYGTERGLDLDIDAVKTVVASKHILREGRWNSEDEVALWMALNTLAKKLCPVTVASLAYMNDGSPARAGVSAANGASGGKSAAKMAVQKYGSRFFVWLLILLVVQMYWLVGTSITNDFETISQKQAELKSQIDKLTLVGRAADDQEIKTLQTERDNTFSQGGTRIEILQKWNNVWGFSTIVNWFRAAGNVGEVDPAKVNDRALLTAGFVLTALRMYVLPLLYGLVGACAYILRNLAANIEARTFSEVSETQYQLRFYLGALSGMAIGWFFTSGTSPTLLNSISPFALAFVAGYGVELLFTAMDRIIDAFSNEKMGAAQAGQPGSDH